MYLYVYIQNKNILQIFYLILSKYILIFTLSLATEIWSNRTLTVYSSHGIVYTYNGTFNVLSIFL